MQARIFHCMKPQASRSATANCAIMGTVVRATTLLVLLTLCQIGQLADAQVLCCQGICSEATDQFSCLALEPAQECPPVNQNCSCVWTNTTQTTTTGTVQITQCDTVGVVTEDDGGGGLGFGWALLIGFGVCFGCIGCCCVAWLIRVRQNKQAQQASGSGPWKSHGSRPGSFRDRPNRREASNRQLISQPVLTADELQEARLPPAMSSEEATEITGYGTPSLSRQISRASSRADLSRNGSGRDMRQSGEYSPRSAKSGLSRQSSFAGSRKSMRAGSRRRLVDDVSADSPAAMEREPSGEISISVRTPRSDYDPDRPKGGTPSAQSASSAGRSIRSQGSLRSESARSQNSFRTRSARSGETGMGGSMRGQPMGGSFRGHNRPPSVHSMQSGFSSSSSRLSKYTQNSTVSRHYDDTPSTAFDSKKVSDDAFMEPLFRAPNDDYGLKKPELQTFTRLSSKDKERMHKVGEQTLSPRSALRKSDEKKKRVKKKGTVQIESRRRASLLFAQLEAEAHSSQLFSKYPTAPITEEDGAASLRNSSSTPMQGVAWTLAQGSFTNGSNGAKNPEKPTKKPPALDLASVRGAGVGVIDGQIGFVGPQSQERSEETMSEADESQLTSPLTSHRHSVDHLMGSEEPEYELGSGGGVDEEPMMTPSALRARARLHSGHVSVLGSEDVTPAISRSVSEQYARRRSNESVRSSEGPGSHGHRRVPSGEVSALMRVPSGGVDKDTSEMAEFVREISKEVGQAQAASGRDRGERRRRSPEPQYGKKKTGSSPEPAPQVHPYHRVSVVAEECTMEGVLQVAEHAETIKEEDETSPMPRAPHPTNENIIAGEQWNLSLAGDWN